MTIMLLVVALFVGSGCQEQRVIPDKDLVNIFHDAYLANAYIDESGISDDSLYLYEPIFERYGYTVEDMRHTLKTFSERKSALLSDLMVEVSDRLEKEAKAEQRKIVVLDTIDNVAKRRYTRTVYEDSLIHVKRLRDTNKLRITIGDLVPAEYTINFDYYIDTLDENRNSRVEVYALQGDTLETLRHTMMLSRYREGSYTRKLNIDSMHTEIFIDMYYHPQHEERKVPDVKIKNFRVVRVIPVATAVDSLYQQQLNLRLFNYDLMMGFPADTLSEVDAPVEIADSIATENETDSLALRTN